MEDALALAGLSSLCALARLLPERDPHPDLYEITLFVLGYLDDNGVWPALYVRWELNLLAELGFKDAEAQQDELVRFFSDDA